MSRRQYRLACENSAHANNSRTATLCFTSCNLLNASFASHTEDRLRLIELQPMRLMHHKNVCTLVTPIGETEPLQTQMSVFKAVFFLFIYWCDEDLYVWTARRLYPSPAAFPASFLHQHPLSTFLSPSSLLRPSGCDATAGDENTWRLTHQQVDQRPRRHLVGAEGR